jgi:nitrilase
VVKSIAEAAQAGAWLTVFPEAYVPGYPTWIWRLRPGGDVELSGDDCKTRVSASPPW